MCCGSRRSAWRPASVAARTPPSPASKPIIVAKAIATAKDGPGAPAAEGLRAARGPFPAVTLHYEGKAAIRLRGPVTGRAYDFSPETPDQPVDVRDAAVLGRNAAFRRATS